MDKNLAPEFVIAVIQGESANQRMVFASRNTDCERPIVLRQETFSSDVGWFTQSSIAMTRKEMVQLRSVMGGQRPQACQTTSQKIEANVPQPTHLRIHKLSVAS